MFTVPSTLHVHFSALLSQSYYKIMVLNVNIINLSSNCCKVL